MTEILFDQGFILNYKFQDDNKQGIIKIALKYNQSTKVPAITKIQRASRPGLRKYSGSTTMPRVLNGLGVAIVSTSKGVITGKQAKKMNVGGEVLCYVY
jgi:small subunit ribosomal protein S8